ncbi:unnamed protein product [Soboliphyme baturini]|uniref:Uncharacterized protein n=1 Tax=Soboliphyme baturini TaxID=241478 RepID=A0A183IX45_9BILA|nr:unnamed protein product [Soboliphyme baturini]
MRGEIGRGAGCHLSPSVELIDRGSFEYQASVTSRSTLVRLIPLTKRLYRQQETFTMCWKQLRNATY